MMETKQGESRDFIIKPTWMYMWWSLGILILAGCALAGHVNGGYFGSV